MLFCGRSKSHLQLMGHSRRREKLEAQIGLVYFYLLRVTLIIERSLEESWEFVEDTRKEGNIKLLDLVKKINSNVNGLHITQTRWIIETYEWIP